MKILIALDTTSHSERAVQFVTCMRWPAGSRVIVATVVPPGAARSPSPAFAGAEEPSPKRPPRHESVITLARDRLRACGLPTEIRIVEGDAREQLLRLTEDERADLLVVGSRGHRGIVQLMLGSVSSHAVGQAKCSVLVVKQGGTS